MSILLLSGDLFVYDARRCQVRYVPRNEPESAYRAITFPDAILRAAIASVFLGELRKLPETDLELAASAESDSFTLFVHRPPAFEEFDEAVTVSIASPADKIPELVNRSGIAILSWVLGFFVRQNVVPEASERSIVWTVALSSRTRTASRGRR